MHCASLCPPTARLLSLAAALSALSALASATPAPDHRFIGTYTVTQVGGAGVQHMELRLRPGGHASLRTDFSRHTQRPSASEPIPPVVESGTWKERAGRAVVHILSTTDDDASASQAQRPQYSELTFVLSGCLLRLVTETATHHGIEFSKKHCLGAI